MSDVKIVVLNAGVQLLGDVEVYKETGKVVVKKPVSLGFMSVPEGHTDAGQVRMVISPFLQYSEEWENGVPFSVNDILTVVTPKREVLNAYNSQHGSGIVVPSGIIK